ncbi:hypothetical protein [Pseudoxanthomonas mexicana]
MAADPPNPYRDLPLREIFAALNERAGELLKGDKPVGRRDTAYLLLAASKWIDDRAASIGSPAHQVRQGTPVPDAFLPEYQHGLRTLRYYELQRARDAAGLDHDAVLAHQKATGTLLGQPATDDEFRAALEWLEAARRGRASGAPGE